MISKDQLAASMGRECDICQHLFTKVPSDAMDYRPTPGQRSTLELVRYLSYCGIGGIRSLSTGDWKSFGEYQTRAATLTPEEFPEAMARQKREIAEAIAKLSDEQLRTQEAKMPGGGVLPLGAALMSGPLKWLTAYKMQLFLYAKQAGTAQIGTANAWAGMDRP